LKSDVGLESNCQLDETQKIMVPFIKQFAVGISSLFLCAVSIEAELQIQLTDGVSTPVVVADGSGADLNTDAGVISWIGSIGVWNLNFTTGTSGGNARYPTLDLNTLNATSTGNGTLNVFLSESDLGPSSGRVEVSVGGTTGGSVTFATYADPGNALFAANSLHQLTAQAFGGVGFSGVAGSTLDLPSPYSLTEVATITHSDKNLTTSLEGIISVVPDHNATVLLMGIGLISLVFIKRLL
jgi:hypothetical protein